jgi:WD40 repeat protein
MRKGLFIFSLIVFMILSACSEKPENATRVEIIDGIKYIHNTEMPLHPNKSVAFEEDLSIGGEDDRGNIVLFRPSRFIVDQNENIYITDSQDQVIKIFDPDGNYMQTIGAKGEGPGEFSFISDQTFLPDGRLLVMDSRSRRISIFHSSGEFLESYQWKKQLGWLQFVTDSSCIISEYIFEGDDPLEGRKLYIKEYDFRGNEICSFGEFISPEMKILTDRNIAFGINVPHSPQSIFASDQKRQCLYHCMNGKYTIEVFDNTGKVVEKIDRPYKPVPFTSKDAEEFRARYENGRNTKKIAEAMAMPKIKTITPRMLVDDSGNLWVQTHEQKEEEDRTFTAYDIFNADGYYEARVWIDKSPSLFMKGKMYRMETDEETGYRFLKRYHIIWTD